MQKLPLNEEAFVRELQEMETTIAPKDLVARLHASRPPRKQWLWAIPAGATALTIGLVPLLIAPPALTLAQVAQKQAAITQYTVINTRIMPRETQRPGPVTRYYRDGERWRSGNIYGLPDRTVTVANVPGVLNHVTIDEHREGGTPEFQVDRLLRPGVKPKIEQNILVDGRRVHRYKLHAVYRAGREETYDQEVLVDPNTNLPIRMTIMRDSKRWGDIWEYKFGQPDPALFVPKVPVGARVFDQRQIRRELPARLARGSVGGLLLDEYRRVFLLVEPSVLKGQIYTKLKLDGLAKEATGAPRDTWVLHFNAVSPYLFNRDYMEQKRKAMVLPHDAFIKIGSRLWQVVTVHPTYPEWPLFDSLRERTTASGSLRLNSGKTLSLQDVPIIRAGEGYSLLAGFPLQTAKSR